MSESMLVGLFFLCYFFIAFILANVSREYSPKAITTEEALSGLAWPLAFSMLVFWCFVMFFHGFVSWVLILFGVQYNSSETYKRIRRHGMKRICS